MWLQVTAYFFTICLYEANPLDRGGWVRILRCNLDYDTGKNSLEILIDMRLFNSTSLLKDLHQDSLNISELFWNGKWLFWKSLPPKQRHKKGTHYYHKCKTVLKISPIHTTERNICTAYFSLDIYVHPSTNSTVGYTTKVCMYMHTMYICKWIWI